MNASKATIPSLILFVAAIAVSAHGQMLPNSNSQSRAPRGQIAFVPGEVVVKLKSGALTADLADASRGRALSASIAGASTLSGASAGSEFQSLIDRYQPEVAHIGRWSESGAATARSAQPDPALRWNAHVERVRARFPVRARRAPAGLSPPDLSQLYVFKVAEADTLAAARELSRDPHVEFAHPNYIGAVLYDALPNVPFIPNDEFVTTDDINWSEGAWGQIFPDLWGLQQIQALEAWDLFADPVNDPGQGVVVAVLDTGVDYEHPDLMENIWINAGEDLNSNGVVDASDFNGIDDDANGYIDDIRGWDFSSNDNDPKDDDFHGTHVAGTIAAVADNGIGIAGVAPNAQIMPLKGISPTVSCSSISEAMIYQTDMGADVSNNSWGYIHVLDFCPGVALGVQYSYANGVVFVVAAGNFAKNFAGQLPMNQSESIVVSASTEDDLATDFTSFGSGVDVAAPGGSLPPDSSTILSALLSAECDDHPAEVCHVDEDCPSGTCATGFSGTNPLVIGDRYLRIGGTSMAAPHVSGVAALLLSQNPALTIEQVRQALRMGADEAGPAGWDEYFGYGRLNALSSLQLPPMPGVHIASVDHEASLFCEETVAIEATAGIGNITGWTLLYRPEDSTTWTGLGAGGGHPPATITWDLFELPEDSYTLELSVTDSAGSLGVDRRRIHRRPYDVIPGGFSSSGGPFTVVLAVAPIDFDRDADQDLALCQFSGAGLWRNNGAGHFVPDAAALPLRNNICYWIDGADLNGDGLGDLVVADNNGLYTVVSDSVGGGYTDHTIPGDGDFYGRIGIGDIDGDSDLDLVSPVGYILLNDGDGTAFVDTTATSAPWWSIPCSPFCNADLADLDQDGDLDLIVDDGVALNDGSGNFVFSAPIDASFSRAVGDLDLDGFADIVYLDVATGMSIRFNDGNGAFVAPAVPIASPGFFGLAQVVLLDLDQDGDLDLMRIEEHLSQPVHSVFVNDGTGAFTESPSHRFYGPQTTRTVRQVDVNADGGLDLVFAGSHVQTFAMRYDDFRCTGDCNLNGAVTITELITSVSIALGDTDLSSCPAIDANRDGTASVTELMAGVNNGGVQGCRCTSTSDAPPVLVDVSDIQGMKGATRTLEISVTGTQGTVGAAQVDLLLEDSVVSIGDPEQDCVLHGSQSNLQIAAFESSDPAPPGFTRVRILVLDEDLQSPITAIADGPIATCSAQISSSAQPSVYRIPAEQPRVSDLDGRAMGAYVDEGMVTVCGGCGCS